MADVFVSYKTEDRRRVQPLVEALQAEGFTVWWDAQIGGGAAWRQTIESELNAAKCVIVVWSKRSVGSEGGFVQDEAARAQQRRVYVPVTIDKVHVPLGFGETQALPLSGWKCEPSDPRFQSVLSAVRRIVGHPAERAKTRITSPSTSGVSRRTVMVGSAAAGVMAVVAGGWLVFKPGRAEAAGSIAVLPFANLSGDPSQAYFSDGIAEELRSALARIPGLKVVGRTSSEAVRDEDASSAAKKLNVANILTGSVRQSPSTIRITAELVDGRTGLDRWSQDYDRSPGDSIKIQTDIAENVAQALRTTLGTVERAAITAGGTNNPAAQKLVLKAMESGLHAGKASLQRAISLLDGATALDPNYADAFALKAILLNVYANNYADGTAELFAYRARSLDTAKSALTIAPDYARSHHAMGFVEEFMLKIGPASAEFKRALELAPSDASIIRDYAYLINRLGRFAESIQLIDKAVTLDPLSPLPQSTRMNILYSARKYADAVRAAQQLQRSSPNLFTTPALTGVCLTLLGRFADAERYYALAPSDDYIRLVGESALLVRTGRASEVPSKIERMRKAYGDAASYQFGQIYAQLGDKDRAFSALGRAWQIRDSGLLNLKVDTLVDPLRGDDRLRQLMAKVGFPG